MSIAQTQAAVLFDVTQPLRILTLGLPPLKPGQVLVEVAYSGICHSQLLEARGRRGPDKFLPHGMGHEGAGVVLEVGAGVAKVKPGDRVVLSWIKGSGADVPSTVYPSAEGRVNSGAICTFMRHTITCENRVTAIRPEMPLREAALLGCAIPTGAGVIFNTAQVSAGQSVAVMGVGGIGLSAVLAAATAGASPIIAIDRVEEKLDRAVHFGATHRVNAARQDSLSAVTEITRGRGVDVAVEAIGRSETMEAAFRLVRNQGGLCVLAGNLPAGGRISIDPFDLIRGKRIAGTWGGETQPDRDIPRYVDLCVSARWRLSDMITHVFALEEVNEALSALEQGTVGRAVLDMGRAGGPGR